MDFNYKPIPDTVKETFSFKTLISKSITGVETRIPTRVFPRISYSASYYFVDNESFLRDLNDSEEISLAYRGITVNTHPITSLKMSKITSNFLKTDITFDLKSYPPTAFDYGVYTDYYTYSEIYGTGGVLIGSYLEPIDMFKHDFNSALENELNYNFKTIDNGCYFKVLKNYQEEYITLDIVLVGLDEINKMINFFNIMAGACYQFVINNNRIFPINQPYNGNKRLVRFADDVLAISYITSNIAKTSIRLKVF